ncbi:MAG TPA: extracellular solute-binding protein [Micromonosporaceae bacterium]|jgi:multiple sugar transport system substrate-binding protein|nr:extracellular solute-binding protein [Micromonosporaceae bacterium]
MKRTTARWAIPVATALFAALALNACSSSPAKSSASGPVTLTFWGTYGNGGNKAQTDVLSQTIIPAFEKAHPNIKVNYVDVPYDSLLQKLTTSAAGGQLPDLVRSDIIWVPKFASLGVFAQLDGKMPNFDTLAQATYPGTLSTNKWQGHYYGLPLDTNTRVLITNQSALTSAGISSPPATFADLQTDATALAAKKIPVFADSGLQGWNILPWIWSGGGQITNADLTQATGYLNSAQSVAAVQMLVNLYKEGEIPNLLIGNKGAVSTQDGLPKGNYANILDGPWMKAIWAGQYQSFQPVYSPMPAGPGGSISVVGGEDIVMTASSKHQDAAEQFIAFTQSSVYQLSMAKTGQMSVVSSLDAQESAASPELAPYIEQLQTARSRPAVPDEPQIDTALQDDLTPAFEGKMTVQAALDKAAKDIDPLLTATK